MKYKIVETEKGQREKVYKGNTMLYKKTKIEEDSRVSEYEMVVTYYEENIEFGVFKDNKIAIQVGAFTDHRNAKSLIKKLSEFKAYIKREFIDDKYIYRVRIGPLSNIDLANQLQDKLFQLGYTSSHLVMN